MSDSDVYRRSQQCSKIRRSPDADSMMGQRRRRWPIIKSAFQILWLYWSLPNTTSQSSRSPELHITSFLKPLFSEFVQIFALVQKPLICFSHPEINHCVIQFMCSHHHVITRHCDNAGLMLAQCFRWLANFKHVSTFPIWLEKRLVHRYFKKE